MAITFVAFTATAQTTAKHTTEKGKAEQVVKTKDNGTVTAQSKLDNCPLKGTPDCPLVKNCPKKGTADCPYKATASSDNSTTTQNPDKGKPGCCKKGEPSCCAKK